MASANSTTWTALDQKMSSDNGISGFSVTVYTHCVSATLPSGQLSNVPWRRAGVKYTNNEAYFDCTEEIDAIIDKSGSVVSAEIQGYIDCGIKLSGYSSLSLSFVNPNSLYS